MVFGAASDVDISGEGPQGEIHFGVGVQAVFTSIKQAYKTPKKKISKFRTTLCLIYMYLIYVNARTYDNIYANLYIYVFLFYIRGINYFKAILKKYTFTI